MFSVPLLELAPSQKHPKMENLLSGMAHSLLESVFSLHNSCSATPTFHRGGGGMPTGGKRGDPGPNAYVALYKDVQVIKLVPYNIR